MKAIGINKNGDLDVIEELQFPVPVPKDNEILIKVHFAGVNFIDTYQRSGLYAAKGFPFVLGSEISGEIVSLPSSGSALADPNFQVAQFKVGDHVCALAEGAFVEYICVSWDKVSKIPNSLDVKVAASVYLQGLTALTFATESYEIKKDDTILVYSGAGGLGIYLIQIAAHRGANVIATVSSEEKAEVAKWAGAQHVIVTSRQTVVDEVLRLTNGEGCEGIFDGVGKDTFDDDFKIAKRKGTIVSLGNASGPVPPFSIFKLADRNLKLLRPRLFHYIHTVEELRRYSTELFELVSKGVVQPKLHGVYPFSVEGIRRTQQELSSRGTIGKLVVKISD